MTAGALPRPPEPSGRTLRRIGYPLELVRARLARRADRVVLVGLGVAAGAAVLALVYAGSAIMEDRSLERAAAALPASDRAVQATWFGTLGTGANGWRRLDAGVRPQLRAATGREPIAAMLYREASIDGRLVDLRAVDGVGRYLRLTSGRLPRRCEPTRCEVLRVAGEGPLPSKPTLRLVEVGTATVPATAPYRDFLGRPPADTAVLAGAIQYHTPPRPPLVVAEGVDGLSRTPELSTFYRSYAWFVPIAAGSVHPWSVDAFRARVDRLRSTIGTQAVGADAFDVTAPTAELTAAAADGRAAGRRLLLLGGEAAALLLAFMVLAASGLRRDADAAWRRLSWFGARRWQLVLFSLSESSAVAAGAAALGWAAGVGLALAAGSLAGVPAGEVVRHSAASGRGIALGALLALAAGLLLFAALRAPTARVGGSRITGADAAALGALLAIAIGLARGGADAGSLASGNGTGVFLLLLPALVAFVAAVVAARLLAPLLRALERAGRRGPVAVRLAALSLARNPGHATVAVTFLVVSLGLSVFAVAYRSTLAAGQRDQAAYAVPADFVLAEDLSQLVPVTHVPPPPGDAIPVVRQTGDVSRLESSSGADVLGIPAAALPRLAGWRGDFASRSPGALARAIAPAGPTALRTLALPAGARTLDAVVAGRGDAILVRATVVLRDGDFVTVRLGPTPSDGVSTLHARLPPRTARLLGLTFELLNNGRRTANAGTGLQPTANGRLELRSLRAGGHVVASGWDGWTPVGGVAGRRGRLAYALTTDTDSGFRLRQPTDGLALPAIVTPRLAAAAGKDGLLPFEITGERVVLRVAAVADRFPGATQPDFVVVDEGLLSTALDSLLPGLGAPTETWLDVPSGEERATAARLARPPYDVLDVRSRTAVEDSLRADPLARGALLVLAGTALVALALAVVGLLLGLLADLRDESGELFDLETQGATPSLLRRHLHLRALVVALFGVLGGVATGAVLSVVVLDLVRLTAGAAAPDPPLVLVVDPTLLLAGGLAFAVAVGAAVVLATRLGFRSAAAGRFREAGP